MKNLSRAGGEVLSLVFLSALILAVLPLMNSQRVEDWLAATGAVVWSFRLRWLCWLSGSCCDVSLHGFGCGVSSGSENPGRSELCLQAPPSR